MNERIIMKKNSIIEIKNLTKYYGKIKGVENLNLELKEGEIFGFVGTKWLWKINASTFISWT